MKEDWNGSKILLFGKNMDDGQHTYGDDCYTYNDPYNYYASDYGLDDYAFYDPSYNNGYDQGWE